MRVQCADHVEHQNISNSTCIYRSVAVHIVGMLREACACTVGYDMHCCTQAGQLSTTRCAQSFLIFTRVLHSSQTVAFYCTRIQGAESTISSCYATVVNNTTLEHALFLVPLLPRAHTHTNRKTQHFFHNKLPFESWCVKQRMSSKDKETRGQAGVVDRVLESKHVERTLLLWRDFFFSFLGRHDRCFLQKLCGILRTIVAVYSQPDGRKGVCRMCSNEGVHA